MANTYIALATTTVGSGGSSSIEFTSIPNTYTDLAVLVSGRNDVNYATYTLTFNADTGNNYTWLYSYSYGSGVYNDKTASTSGIVCVAGLAASSFAANNFANSLIYIPNYAGSNKKSVSAESACMNSTTGLSSMISGIWNSTSAITSVKLTAYSGGKFTQYSTATLYGIKNS